MAQRLAAANEMDMVLRYIARLMLMVSKVGVEAVRKDHPLTSLLQVIIYLRLKAVGIVITLL